MNLKEDNVLEYLLFYVYMIVLCSAFYRLSYFLLEVKK